MRGPVPALRPDPVVDLLREIRDELRALRADRRRPSRAGLLPAIAAAKQEQSFTATDVLLDAEKMPALEQALDAARITSVRELGKALKVLEGRLIYGCRLERQGVKSDGVVYRVFPA